MKELLRIEHAAGNQEQGGALKDYNMEIFEGEIVYMQGADGSGIREIASLLSGDMPLYEGQIYIDGKKEAAYNRNKAYEKNIFPISADGSMIATLTVAENMEALRSQRILMKPYISKKMEKRVDAFLSQEGIGIRAKSSGGNLCSEEEIQLSILKAKMHGARLIILEILNSVFEGSYAEEMAALIKNLCHDGISFLILSSSYSHFVDIATRIQFVYRGRDLKEWNCLSGEVVRLLKSQNPDTFTGSDTSTGQGSGADKGNFLGMYDYEWENDKCIWDYLKEVRRYNANLWEEYLNVLLPEKGIGISQDVLVIPKESGNLWFNNLNIVDNLLMSIPQKIAGSRYGIVRRNRKEHVVNRFYDMLRIDKNIKEVKDLTKAQKKLFSIYRYELLRPKVIFLENPYWGMDQEEIIQIRHYLTKLQKRGSAIVCCAKSIDEMKVDCSVVIQTDNAKNARMIRI